MDKWCICGVTASRSLLAGSIAVQEHPQRAEQGCCGFTLPDAGGDGASVAGHSAVGRQHDDGQLRADALQQIGDQQSACHVAIDHGRLNGIGEQRVQGGLGRADNNNDVSLRPQRLDAGRQGIGLVVDTKNGSHAGR